MAKELEEEYYRLPKDDFSRLLDSIRKNPQTIHFFGDSSTPYFFLSDPAATKVLLQLHSDNWEFESLFKSFSKFGQTQLIQSFLIREIESTNGIENIHSTRHDIFTFMQRNTTGKDKKLISILNGYSTLLKDGIRSPSDLHELRDLYDLFFKGAIEKEDRPDGTYFRKGPVFITNGLKNVHRGFFPEEAVNNAMNEFLGLYNDQQKDLFERLILSHFLIETVHPFYVGNGRFGLFLFTQKYFEETGSYLAFSVSAALNRRKSSYYKALDEARHEHMYGSLNAYFGDIAEILHLYTDELNHELREKKERIETTVFSKKDFTVSERKILQLLAESTLLSDFGISNAEILENTSVSKRTLISSMQRFRELKLLEETKFSRTVYHKLREMVTTQKISS